jgi:hypothetical protein
MTSDLSRVGTWCLITLGSIAAAWVLGSCYPGGPTSTGELDLVSTFYDQDYNFGALRTYAMPDTIYHIEDEENPDNNVELSRDHDQFILEQVATNMENLGYQRVIIESEQDSADVAILISAMGTKNFVVSPGYPGWGWWPGWGWGGGWWGPGWGWGYPWVPPTVSSYQTGTLWIDLLDPDDRNEEEDTIPVHWYAAINGLLSGSTSEARLGRTIDQAFAQSQYLRVQQ